MTLIIENGSGVAGANSYVLATFVSAYLTDRNRAAENGWANGAEGPAEDAACVAATDYIENANRERFKGNKEFADISLARATLSFTVQPTPAEAVVIGSITYTFVAALTGAGDVLIGGTLAETVANLIGAVNLDENLSGTGFDAATAENVEAIASHFYGDQVVAFAKTTGTGGNAVVTTTTATGAAWNFATCVGGTDFQLPQPLSFPRSSLYDADGVPVLGTPYLVKAATAEYAVRARDASVALAPDPTIDPLGGIVTSLREKVGPIDTATQYLAGTTNQGTLPAYPAADRMLAGFIKRGGVVIR